MGRKLVFAFFGCVITVPAGILLFAKYIIQNPNQGLVDSTAGWLFLLSLFVVGALLGAFFSHHGKVFFYALGCLVVGLALFAWIIAPAMEHSISGTSPVYLWVLLGIIVVSILGGTAYGEMTQHEIGHGLTESTEALTSKNSFLNLFSKLFYSNVRKEGAYTVYTVNYARQILLAAVWIIAIYIVSLFLPNPINTILNTLFDLAILVVNYPIASRSWSAKTKKVIKKPNGDRELWYQA